MTTEIIVVSGLPRSGTSLMMQMLDRGGIEVVTDHLRTADPDNPRGYYELEKVKQIKGDRSWLPGTRGKAFKMISQLLLELPSTETYCVLFMERDLDEILTSQEKMLQRLGRPAGPREQMKRAFTMHLDKVNSWLAQQPYINILRVSYTGLIERPQAEAQRVNHFLGGRANVENMVQTVDPALYRNRIS